MGLIASNFIGWKGGVLMSIIAFSIVFLVIVGLMLMMMALKSFANMFTSIEASDNTPKAASAAPASPAGPSLTSAVPTAAAVQTGPASSDDEEELAAILTAAISAACGFDAVIRSFAPVFEGARGSMSAWRMSSISQNSQGPRG
jgi:Na+-transporting methylmalonyl-CoA/oxaloacetate decarboxylase gamma subunit